MSYDQRPARATKRLVVPTTPPAARPKEQVQPSTSPKRPFRVFVIFLAATLIGGMATTALMYGLIPSIPAVALLETSHR